MTTSAQLRENRRSDDREEKHLASPALRKWAGSNGWKEDSSIVYGRFGGYLFSARDDGYSRVINTAVPALTSAQKDSITSFLLSNKRKLRIYSFKVERPIISVALILRWPISPKIMLSFFEGLAQAMRMSGVLDTGLCGMCGRESATVLTAVNNTVVPMCEACADQACAEAKTAASNFAAEDKNYSGGVLGALLGGAIGSIPWILVSAFANLMVAWLGYLIGYCALRGYRMLKGKISKATPWIVAGVTIVCVFGAELIALCITLAQNDIPPSLDALFFILSYPELSGDVWLNVVLGSVLAAAGIWPLFSKIQNEIDTAAPRIRKLAA
jgi:hypothetical protein